MLFKWKKLYILAEERLEKQREYIRKIKKDKISYDNIMDNLNFILDKYDDYNINMYLYNDQPYYIVETWVPDIWENDYTIELHTYKLEQVPVRTSPITELSAKLRLNDFYEEKTAYIESIDTMKELRQGHGSQILRRFIYIAKNIGVSKIKGKLYIDTHIGIDNLKKFYIKNGFTVGETSFIMILKETKEF